MSEIPKHSEAQSIIDAVELAFWGQQFEDGEEQLRQYAPEGLEHDMFDVQMRGKSGYDVWRRCPVRVQQVRCVVYDEGSLESVDMIFAHWDDGLLTAINTIDLYSEQRNLTEYTENSDTDLQLDEQQLIAYTKHALAQVTDLTA